MSAPGKGDEGLHRLVTSSELSEMLVIPVRTLDQWAYLGKGPASIRVGRYRRYRLSDVEAWIDRNTKPNGGSVE